MKNTKHIQSGIINNKRGAAYVIAIATMLAGMMLALATLRIGNAYFLAANSRIAKQNSVNLAEGGLDYAYWLVKNNITALPFTTSITLSSGIVQITAVDDSASVPSGMLITSTANCGGSTHTATRVMSSKINAVELPYAYLWCEDSDISTFVEVDTSGTLNGIRSNGNIDLSSYSNYISNGVWAKGIISTHGFVSPKFSGSSYIDFPQFSVSDYYSIANDIRSSGTTISNLSYAGQNRVIYVSGSCSIDSIVNGQYAGVITIFSEGLITVKCKLTQKDSNSHLSLISPFGIRIANFGADLQAVMYSSNWGTGYIQFDGNVGIIKGNAAADNINITGFCPRINLVTDTSINTAVLKALHLPGT